MALLYHADQGSGKVIGLLIWSGAQPHTRIKDPRDPDNETGECAIEAAVRRGDVAILKQMHPERHPELITSLTKIAYSNDSAMLDYLLSIGAVLNDKPNGGSSLVDRAFGPLGFSSPSPANFPSGSRFWAQRAPSGFPTGHGQSGVPDGIPYKASPSMTFEVIKALLASGVSSSRSDQGVDPHSKSATCLGAEAYGTLICCFTLRNLNRRPPTPRQSPATSGSELPNSYWRRLNPKLEHGCWISFAKIPAFDFGHNPSLRKSLPVKCRLLGIDEESKRDPVPFLNERSDGRRRTSKR